MNGQFLLAPGRGSYARDELGTLTRLEAEVGAAATTLLDTLESLRQGYDPDLPTLRELDQAPAFKPGLHLPGRNASPLIYACTLLAELRHRVQGGSTDCVAGNSLGFYTALALSDALSPEEGYRLVSTMARLQEEGPKGGQILWTLLDDDWNVLPARESQLQQILRIPDLDLSIRLGGHVVLAGSEKALAQALAELPKVKLGKREFPFRLPFHGPFHTPLLESVAARARSELADLDIRRPRALLIDGRGFEWSPLATDPRALLDYTLGPQITRTFDFTTMIEKVLLDYAPTYILLLEPGASLRAPVGHIQKWLAL